MKPDKTLTIAVGPSRETIVWANKHMAWQDFLARLSRPVYTTETAAEYEAMTKTQRDKVKDVGGFVGGYLKAGRRKNGHCTKRSLVTLDADTPSKDFITTVGQVLAGTEWVVYSTHSHTVDKPRYRLIVPLARRATADEYVPLALKLAEKIGLGCFDPTTYQVERLMYWPSLPQDGQYDARHAEATAWLNPDDILGLYDNWADSSSWPQVGVGYRRRSEKKQGDPRSKPAVIGAFNRSFTVSQAIAVFLPDRYTAGQTDKRYSYTGASTTNGLVVYDNDLFAFSNHATDPCSGRLVSAFDLVRLHKFGQLDEDAKEDTPIAKLPSSVQMRQWASNLEPVRRELAAEQLRAAREDFNDGPAETSKPANNIADLWARMPDVTDKGKPRATAKNLGFILDGDEKLKGAAGTDLFADRITLLRCLPWRSKADHPFWMDADDAGLRVYLERNYTIESVRKIDDAKQLWFRTNSFHPVRNWLDGLDAWDGLRRAETVLIDYLGAEDDDYTRFATRKWLTAAVARVYEPGTDFQNMLLLSGPQGIGKTELAKRLGGSWYGELHTMEGNKAVEDLLGSWIVEVPEMMATKRADIETQKAFISRKTDKTRLAYARNASYYPRQCVFIGTTNETAVLKDRTGNRRYWPVECGIRKTHNLNTLDVEQLWAEVKTWYFGDEALALTRRQIETARQRQATHTDDDGLEGVIEEYLAAPIPADWYDTEPDERRDRIRDQMREMGVGVTVERTKVCVAEVWVECLGEKLGRIHPVAARRIREALSALRWRKHTAGDGRLRFGKGYGRQVAFVRALSKGSEDMFPLRASACPIDFSGFPLGPLEPPMDIDCNAYGDPAEDQEDLRREKTTVMGTEHGK